MASRRPPWSHETSGPSPVDGLQGARGRGDNDVSESTRLLDTDAAEAPLATPTAPGWTGAEDFGHLPWWRRPSIFWLLGPYLLFALAFGCSIVPKLNLILGLICARYFADRELQDPILLGHDTPQCLIPKIQKDVANFTLALNIITGLLSALSTPRLGSLSDRYGRKTLIIVCSLGGILSEAITILAASFPETVHYNWLLLGAFFDGLTGSFTAGSVICHSYASDTTPPSRRSVAIGRLHACLFGGLAFGPLVGAYLVEWTGSLLSVFYVTLACHVFFALFIFFFVPESLSLKRQLATRDQHARQLDLAQRRGPPAWTASLEHLPFGRAVWTPLLRWVASVSPLGTLKVLVPRGARLGRLRRNLLILAGIDMILFGTSLASGTLIILYSEYQFGWGNFESSHLVSLVSLVRVLVLMAVLPVINYVFRVLPARRKEQRLQQQPPEQQQQLLEQPSQPAAAEKNAGADEVEVWVLRMALLSDVLGILGYSLVRTSSLFVLSAVVSAFGGLGAATIQASASKHVPAEQVGRLLGAIGLLQALARVAMPILLNSLYAATVESFPQAVFVVLSVLLSGCLAAAMWVRPHVYLSSTEIERIDDSNNDDAPERPFRDDDDSNGTPDDVSALRDTLRDENVLPPFR